MEYTMRACHFQMEVEKMDKREEFHNNFISLRQDRSKGFYMMRSFSLQYIYTYIYKSANTSKDTVQ